MTTLLNQLSSKVKPIIKPSGKVQDTKATPSIPILTPDEQRTAQLNAWRLTVCSAALGIKSGGGSDLLKRVFKALGMVSRHEALTTGDVSLACRKISTKANLAKAIAWVNVYVDGLEGKNKETRRKAFLSYIQGNCFEKLADAIDGLTAAQAFTWEIMLNVKVPKSGVIPADAKFTVGRVKGEDRSQFGHPVGLRSMLNVMFGWNVTPGRLANAHR